uniref:Uncharacterized protein n=1 Tax=Zea mays TaxID=4577 RepID=B4FX82_MAIZE|nr:unknown [Zea mays]
MRAKNFYSAVSRGLLQRGQPQASCWTIHSSAIQVTTTNMVPYIHLQGLKSMIQLTVQETTGQLRRVTQT